jgi:hypothetical protein
MCRRPRLLLLAALLALLPTSFPAAARQSGASDEQVLRSAGVSVEGPALLEFFRNRTPVPARLEQIHDLIRQLGADKFAEREKASSALISLGPVAVPFLQRAVNDRDSDLEVKRRAEKCLEVLRSGPNNTLVAAAARVLAKSRQAGVAEALLNYLPSAPDEPTANAVRGALADVAVRDGRPEKVVVVALTDKLPVKRAAAAEALCRAGFAGQRDALVRLLKDPETTVRLRVALALAARQERAAVPVLIDLLATLPPEQTGPVEDLLERLVGPRAPIVALGTENAPARASALWAAWWRDHGATVELKLTTAVKPRGFTLVVEERRIYEVDAAGAVRWSIDGLNYAFDAQMLDDDRLLITEYQGGCVTERNLKGEVLWEKRVVQPICARRFANGHTFIATCQGILELDRAGNEIFNKRIVVTHLANNKQIQAAQLLVAAHKQRNGQVVCVTLTGLCLRLDATGRELKSFPVQRTSFGVGIDVLPNGRLLLPLYTGNQVVETDAEGQVVWRVATKLPGSAQRLANGNTLVTSKLAPTVVTELDATGRVVWDYRATGRLVRAYRR